MKLSTLIILFFAATTRFMSASAQNVSINILTQNSGLVSQGGTVYLQVTICNTDPAIAVPAYKLRPQISVPSGIVSIPATGHDLPGSWTITFNSGSVIRLSNATDQVPANTCRTLLIAMQGNTIGGPSTISGNLLFSNGVAPGSASGPATPGDLTADNSSQSTVQVYDPVPVTLVDFTVALINCQPALNWITETEINSDRFEIERSNLGNSNWETIGSVAARGNTTARSEYNFIDRNLSVSSAHVLYRLKMIDQDGHYKYSEILRVSTDCKIIQAYVYPNPVQNGKLYVSLTGASEYADVSLISVSGQVILKTNMNNGTNYLDVSNIANGIYVLSIKGANGLDKKLKVFIQQ